MGKECEKEYTHTHTYTRIQVNHFAIHQKQSTNFANNIANQLYFN